MHKYVGYQQLVHFLYLLYPSHNPGSQDLLITPHAHARIYYKEKLTAKKKNNYYFEK